MLIETSLREIPIVEVAGAARRAEALGFDGLTFSEIRQDPFLVAAVAATGTERIRLATSVAIAFPRSPMVVAYGARNLQDLSGGRFAVGLGTQVRGHVVRRFSAPWDAPGPRLREYARALRAIWDCWQHGAPLDFRGDYYSFTLMTPEFNLGPTPHRVQLHLAAVNPYNIQTAALYADALRVHSFCTPEYLREVIWPRVRRVAEQSGRSLDDFEMINCGFIASGPTEAAVHGARENVRKRVAFYASTPSYAPVLEHHGWHDLGPRLRELIARSRWDDLAGLVPDDVLDRFCFAAPYDAIAGLVRARLGGLLDRLSFPLPHETSGGRDALESALAELKTIPTAREQRGPVPAAGV